MMVYAAPVTRNMLHFSNLSYYVLPQLLKSHAVPSWISVQLGVFAGSLYIEYTDCEILTQLLEHPECNDTQIATGSDNVAGGLAINPASFLLEWLALRRNGQDVTNTPVGYLCEGRPLNENHYFFARRDIDGSQTVPSAVGGRGRGADEDCSDNVDSDFEEEWENDE